MISTDLQSVTTLPVHTRKETIVGRGFDVLNGREKSIKIGTDLKAFDGTLVFLTQEIVTSAKSLRRYVELYFDLAVEEGLGIAIDSIDLPDLSGIARVSLLEQIDINNYL